MVGFKTKHAGRDWVWDALQAKGLARFPFPPHGRIPNFAGADQAASRLVEGPLLAEGVERVKVNPDAPQRFVREALLGQGVEVYVPTPRLKGGFWRLDPARIPAGKVSDAAALSKMQAWATPVALDALPSMDAIVTGSVAVTRTGHRAGKGEGYADLEYAILRELGHDPCPVATTVHPIQVVDALPQDATDVPLSWIVTPEETIRVEDPPSPPEGIDWGQLSDARVQAMPVLEQLRDA